MFPSRALKISIIVIIVFAIAGVANALAASNTVPDSYEGDGAGTISGYTVSSIQYHLSNANPATIDSVTFNLDAAATDVQIRLSGSKYDCGATSGVAFDVTCTTTGASSAAATSLQVMAGDIVVAP